MISIGAYRILLVLSFISSQVVAGTSAAQTAIHFSDVTVQAALNFKHDDGSRGKRWIVETLASGLAVFDYDLDGDDDIYFLSASLPGESLGIEAGNQLYRNDGGMKFTPVSIHSHSRIMGFALAVAAADFDNDGWPDLLISNYGPNVLLHNNGDGTFEDVTAVAGVSSGGAVGAGVNFLDANRDGNLDIFASNYVLFDSKNPKPTFIDGVPRYSSPKLFDAESDRLFLSRGDGTFEDASVSSGIAGALGTGMGTLCIDYDEDGDTDILVLNDVRPNHLFQNDGNGIFEEVGLLAGVAFNGEGNVLGSMGVDAIDYDHDGHIDLFQTAYMDEHPVLRQNLGGGFFDDITRSSRISIGLYKAVNWGTCFADFDNDRYADIFVANGHLQDNINNLDGTASYGIANAVLRNNGTGEFDNVTADCGESLKQKLSSRGAAVSDFDQDGKIDVVVLNARTNPTLLRNDTPDSNHWFELKLVGQKSNRDGVGARVQITVGDDQQTLEVYSGRGYQSHWGLQLHVGLGAAKVIDRLEVLWPSGIVQRVEQLQGDQRMLILEQQSP